MTRVLGIDPGAKGAAALIQRGGLSNFPRIEIVDLPFTEGRLNYRLYRDLLREWQPTHAYIENVWPRFVGSRGGGMGFNAAAKFMDNAGALKGITACEVPAECCHLVTPVSWKKMFRLVKDRENPNRDVKSEARAMLADLFLEAAPLVKRKMDDGRAEAGLIATYGAVRQGMIELASA